MLHSCYSSRYINITPQWMQLRQLVILSLLPFDVSPICPWYPPTQGETYIICFFTFAIDLLDLPTFVRLSMFMNSD